MIDTFITTRYNELAWLRKNRRRKSWRWRRFNDRKSLPFSGMRMNEINADGIVWIYPSDEDASSSAGRVHIGVSARDIEYSKSIYRLHGGGEGASLDAMCVRVHARHPRI